MDDMASLIKHYRKKSVGIRSAMSREGVAEPALNVMAVRAATYEDVAEDLEAWLATQEGENDN
tara:strand:- start:445 stop:633 length:189 start_codon:yes stop_codon:yes gene_type:complete